MIWAPAPQAEGPRAYIKMKPRQKHKQQQLRPAAGIRGPAGPVIENRFLKINFPAIGERPLRGLGVVKPAPGPSGFIFMCI